jgi:hypothetical protein
MVGPSTCGDDHFWQRMESLDSSLDLPEMTASMSVPRDMPFVELVVSTPAGKPIHHFSHGHIPADGTVDAFRRPHQDVLSLCAMAVAFAGICPDVSHVRTPVGVMFFASTHCLHLAVAAADSEYSIPVLASLARLTVAFLAALFSTNLATTLSSRPNIDVSPYLDPYRFQLDNLLKKALAHPLPYATLSPASLPCPTSPTSRSSIVELLRSSIARASPLVSFGIIFTTSPPLPRKLVAIAAPFSHPLTSLDICFLTSIPHEKVSSDWSSSTSDSDPSHFQAQMERIFLQCTGHSVPYVVSHDFVELRLQADDYEAFNAAVGGVNWRPEWTSGGGDVVSVLVCARAGLLSDENESRAAAVACVQDIKKWLAEARGVRDVIVAMERPFVLSDIPATSVSIKSNLLKALVVFSRNRLAATIGGTDHVVGEAFADALLAPGDRPNTEYFHGVGEISSLSYGSNSNLTRRRRKHEQLSSGGVPHPEGVWCVIDYRHGLIILGFCKLVMAAYSLEADLVGIVRLFSTEIVPWAKKYERSLVSEFDRIAVPPRRILGNFLAPFTS